MRALRTVPCFTCGLMPTSIFDDGSPRYDHGHDPKTGETWWASSDVVSVRRCPACSHEHPVGTTCRECEECQALDLTAIAAEIFADLLPDGIDARICPEDPHIQEKTIMIEYIEGCEPVPQGQWEAQTGRPSVQTRIWHEGDIGWVADIIEAAWSAWRTMYPGDLRTVGQAIPYVHLRDLADGCDRPRTSLKEKSEYYEFVGRHDDYGSALESWEQGGRVGPEPVFPAPYSLGHAHEHDHGICIEPWLLDNPAEGQSLVRTLRHELAHAIAGTFGHDSVWRSMCRIIGHELTPEELVRYRTEDG